MIVVVIMIVVATKRKEDGEYGRTRWFFAIIVSEVKLELIAT